MKFNIASLSIDKSEPLRSDSAKIGLAALFEQFNDYHFYFEDSDCEQIYLRIIKKTFPEIKLEKIFALSGKASVLNESKMSQDRNKLFVVDLDYDDVENLVVIRDNLVYLDRYSIENYFMEEWAWKCIIIEESPKKYAKTECVLLLHEHIGKIGYSLTELYCLMWKLRRLSVKNVGQDIGRFTSREKDSSLNADEINRYITDSLAANEINESEWGEEKNEISKMLFQKKTISDFMARIPGKHLLTLVKLFIQKEYGFKHGLSNESLMCRMAENNEFNEIRQILFKKISTK